jgi:ubiquinone/menaquinone biosynthesis C-methylase UbiE
LGYLFSVPGGLIDGVHTAAPQVAFIEGNAQELPLDTFPDNVYDLHTIVFGTRNVTSIPDVLREVYRVLRPVGIFTCLEFNKVTNPLLAVRFPTLFLLLGSIPN